MLRLLKPLEYYEEKYGTHFFGVNRMYLMMEKQRNRGQDGCGVANVKLDVSPGTKYMHCEKSIDKDPIKDVFERVQRMGADKLQRAPAEARLLTKDGSSAGRIDPGWIKENVPFAGELFLAHVRYGTDSDNSIDRCHPVLRESNWMTRSLLLAGNFNITNNEDLFASLVQIGQHPRELSDTVTLLEKVGHFVDKENNDLYVKYAATGQAPRTCFSHIAENINVARILRRASTDWDGGYCIAGVFGHGDSFVLRDPCGIRPAFYFANDEVIVVASEAPLIQTVFQAPTEEVHPLPPGQALVVKRSGKWSLETVLPAQPLKQCSFERIYFSRGNDAGVYRERERLGRALLLPLMKMLEAKGDSLANTVLSFIPNTSELAFNGLMKEAQDEMGRRKASVYMDMLRNRGTDPPIGLDVALAKTGSMSVRMEKVVHKDAKIRTFIQEDSSREHLTMHAYDVHYGTVRPGDVLVALDDSIVRGNTLKNAILRTLDRLGPKRIVVLSSCPQIRFPDPYGIDMAKMGDLAAFKASITMLQERGLGHIITEVYKACRAQLARPLQSGDFVNHVKRIYDPFTPEEISAKIVEQITPADCKAEVEVLFGTVEGLHEAMPEHAGDWYFTGDYPTKGGTKVCCRAFVLWMEGSSARCYGVSSASSCAQTPVLVVGQGGSEHALAWKLSQSHEVGCVYVAPGNGGTTGNIVADSGADKRAPLIPVDIPLTAPDFTEVKDFCRERAIVLAVVGSDAQLTAGLGDALRASGVPVFGPSQDTVAKIDSSSSAAQEFAEKYNVPMTLRHASPQGQPLEEWPRGAEVSVIAVSDGVRYSVLPAGVQDHKRALEEDRGPITEGMGAVAPAPNVDAEMLARIEREILKPVFEGLRKEDVPFTGCLHVEVALLPSGPKALRFRPALGDPVAQVVVPLLDCDLFEVLSACAGSRLSEEHKLTMKPETCAVAVVMASGGYGSASTVRAGHTVSGIDRALCVPGCHIFHTCTSMDESSSNGGVHAQWTKRSPNGRSTKVPTPPTLMQKVISCGGRVLTVAALARGLHEARDRAYVGIRAVKFNESWYRHDIAALASMTSTPRAARADSTAGELPGAPARPDSCEFTYRAAGVDSAACEAALASFEPLMLRTRKTRDNNADFGNKAYNVVKGGSSTLVSSTSALGTKLKIASIVNNYDGAGIDLVALCVNDIVSQGAEPLFFHEHLAIEKLDAHQAMQLVKGVSDGCVEANCELLDAGVSELPGIFAPGGCDFVGFAVGAVEKADKLPKMAEMEAGDVLIALPASGLHSNGFSLVRAIARAAGLEYTQAAPFDPTHSLGEALLTPTRIYAKPVLELVKEKLVRGAAHVSRGGLRRCMDTVLPQTLAARLHADTWELPAALRWLAAVGKVPCGELASTFNCGLGMILVVTKANVERALKLLREQHEEPIVVGELISCPKDAPRVELEGAEGAWLMLPELGVSLPFPEILSSLQDPYTVTRMRMLVIAGNAEVTPLQALIQATAVPASAAALVGVVSPTKDSPALALARSSRIKDIVLGDGKFAQSEFFCDGLDGLEDDVKIGKDIAEGLDGADPDSIAAADFSNTLQVAMDATQAEMLVVLDDIDITLITRSFLERHAGRVVLVHASLLPAFPGPAPIEAALRSGVCITGCTISFAVPPAGLGPAKHCFGPQILQETVRIAASDTAFTLRSRLVAQCESPSLPRAVQLVASGSVALRQDGAGFGLGRSASFTEAASEGMLAGNGSVVTVSVRD